MSYDDPPAGFVRPFRYDGHHYLWDANGEMAADFGGEDGALRARGWGRIQYLDGADGLMTLWEAWLLAKANGSTDPDEVVKRLNGDDQ